MTTEFRRVSNEEDVRSVAALALEIWPEHYVPIIGRAQVEYMLEQYQSAAAITSQIRQGYEYYLVSDGRDWIGYLAVLLREGNELFLSKIYLRRAARGSGHGRACFDFVRERARQLGARSIVLTVNKNNRDTIAAYERWGFKRVRALVADIGGGYVMDDWEYRLEADRFERFSS